MPRRIDLTKRNATDWDESLLPEPRYGEREIRPEEVDALAEAFKAPVGGFWPQFTTYSKSRPRKMAERMDAAHAWLSAHATGPWSWHEGWSNHGHALDVHVYVEREPDQRAFAGAHADLFEFRPDEPRNRLALAVNRGALPRLTARESFSRWTQENQGFEYLPAKDLGEHGLRVAITHPEIEAGFREAFADRFAPSEHDGRACYAGSTQGLRWHESPTVWLSRHAALGDMSGGKTKDGGYAFRVEARYPDAVEAFQRDWGHVFTLGEDGRTFSAPDYPSTPPRELPADFAAYLAGEREDYDDRHLPETVRALRDGAAAGPKPR